MPPLDGGRNKAKRVGPYSRRPAFTTLDIRTREGKFAAEIRAQLIEHVGGEPTVPQQLLIQVIVLRVLRIAMLSDVIAHEPNVCERDDRQLGAWLSGLRRDLETLGLKAPEQQIPKLAEYLEARKRPAV